MVSYQRQRSRSTVGIEPHIRQLKTYKKERAGKRLKRERESERETERERERQREREREREMRKKISMDDRSKD